jgi:hypothetical protein
MFCVTVVLAAALLAGCTSEDGRFTIISTKNVDLASIDSKPSSEAKNIARSDRRLWILFIPLGSAPTTYEIIDKCLDAGDGDYMTSAKQTRFWWSLLLVSWQSMTIEGDVRSTTARKPATAPPAHEGS